MFCGIIHVCNGFVLAGVWKVMFSSLLCFINKIINLEIRVGTKTYNDSQILSMNPLNRACSGSAQITHT